MRASVFVGRVGGLAVALGIGAAAGCLTAGVAGASPDDATDSSARSEASAAGSTQDGTSGSRSRVGRSVAAEPSSGGRQSGGVKGARGPVVKNDPGSAAASGRVESDGLASVSPAESVLSPVRVSTEVAEDRLLGPTASVPVEAMPVASTVVGLVPGVAEADADASVMAPATATSGAMEAVDEGWSGLVPGGPGELAASWVMVAAARRETRSRAILLGTAARTVAAGGLPDAERLPTAAAAVVGEDSVHAVAPAAAEVSVDPITAIVQQVQAVISGIVEAVTQFVNQVVTVVNQIVTAIVNIFVPVAPVNSAPTATNPTVGIPDSVTGAVTGVVSATDTDGDILTYSAPASTSKGSIAIDSSTGAFTYAPTVSARENAAKVGATDADKADSFVVTVTDGRGGSTDVSVAVVISPLATTPTNSAPTAGVPTVGVPDAITGVVTGKVNASDPDGDSLTFSAPASTSKGSIGIDAVTGEFTYTPTVAARQNAANAAATPADKFDTFAVTVSDGRGGATTTSVTVPIARASTPINSAPVIGAVTLGSPDPSTGTVAGRINATDVDGDVLIYGAMPATTKGSVTVNVNSGAFTYTPKTYARQDAAKVGATAADKSDTLIVTVRDGRGGSASFEVNVPISPLTTTLVNSPPVAGLPTVGIPNPTTGVVLGQINATDSDGDTLTYSGTTTTPKGNVVVNATTGAFSYTPTAAARQNAAAPTATTLEKSDGFTISVSDGRGGSTAVPVAVVISPAAPEVHNTVIATVGVGGTPYKVAVSPDGTRAYVTNYGSGTVSVINTSNNQNIATIAVGGSPVGVAVSSDGTTVYVADNYGSTISVIRSAGNSVTGTASVGLYPYGVAFSPNGKTAFVANVGGGVTVIDTATNSTRSYSLDGALYDIAVGPNNTTAYVSDVGNRRVLVLNTATNTYSTIGVGNNPYGLALAPDGSRLYVVHNVDDTVSVINTATNKVINTIAVGRSPWSVAVSPDGKTAYVVNQGGNSVSVIRTSDNTVTATIPVGSRPSGVAFSPDSKTAYVTNKNDFTVSVISV